MKLVLIAISFASARLIISDDDELASTLLSRSSRDLIGYNRLHNTAQIHRMKAFKNPNFTKSVTNKSIDEILDGGNLSEAQWNKLRQRMAAIRRLKRARMLKILGY